MMGRPEPTLGMPTRSAAIRSLHAGGCSPLEIAEALGVHPGQVYGALSYARRKGAVPVKPRARRAKDGEG